MKISAIVVCYLIDEEKKEILKKCIAHLKGYDELIVYVVSQGPSSFCEAWNTAASFATGDYLVFIGDNNYLAEGSLRDLAVKDTVTSPVIIEAVKDSWGHVFCLPREIYEAHGLYDMIYSDGINWMDIDLLRRLQKHKVPMRWIDLVQFHHPQGGRTVNRQENLEEKSQRNLGIFNKRWANEEP